MCKQPRRGAGVVELAALEKRYGATHRGFESLPLRHEMPTVRGLFYYKPPRDIYATL